MKRQLTVCRCGSLILAALLLVTAFSGCSETAEKTLEQRMEEYYSGKIITLINNYDLGGGTDVWASTFINHLGKHIPGHPIIIMEHHGGAAGLVGQRYLAEVCKPDGYFLGALGGNMVSSEATRTKDVPASASHSVLGVVAGFGDVTLTAGSTKTFPEAGLSVKPGMDKWFFGIQEKDATLVRSYAQFDLLGLKYDKDYKFIWGYSSGSAVQLACGQGETSALFIAIAPFIGQFTVNMVETGNGTALWQDGMEIPGGLVRHPAVPNVPLFDEVYKQATGKDVSGIGYEFTRWRNKANAVMRTLAFPPKTPDWIVEGMRNAVAEMLKDPAYLDDQEKIFGTRESVALVGKDAEAMISEVLGSSAEYIEYIDSVFSIVEKSQ